MLYFIDHYNTGQRVNLKILAKSEMSHRLMVYKFAPSKMKYSQIVLLRKQRWIYI